MAWIKEWVFTDDTQFHGNGSQTGTNQWVMYVGQEGHYIRSLAGISSVVWHAVATVCMTSVILPVVVPCFWGEVGWCWSTFCLRRRISSRRSAMMLEYWAICSVISSTFWRTYITPQYAMLPLLLLLRPTAILQRLAKRLSLPSLRVR